ncbi:4-hydroxybenzoate polyprenyltransferase [Allocatelliglobosispora scoriae]|uniref:4-hydroxybenzoate polyprenyltransferase n=1 Tax=Allocatelliglobosispora scoriae TaxID=643052 RepID=A0A841BXG1_9ACTN|nr:UbiA prenyltransferase family protein [Allocatelliglobosispora scoriae]MBB5871452.1 4-hydroxybenzoate polyprenyltransferase [Allocatelliglobosispora scoriae]
MNRQAAVIYASPDAVTVDSPTVTRETRPLHQISAHVALLRPRHWIKGSLVLVAPLITAPVASLSHIATIGLTLLSFLIAASTVYVVNDLRDRESDRLHPVKRLRPLASGRVSVPAAVAVLVVLLVVTLALLVTVPPLVAAIIGVYLVMNLWYSLSLKHQPLVDVSVVAGGFVLRVLAGTIAAGLDVQPILLICVYCACVALSLGKRRHELAGLAADETAARHRPVLAAYSVQFLDHVVVVNLVAALVCYVASMSQLQAPYGAAAAGLTFPFAAFTVYRYLQMLMVERSGGDPVEDLIRDRSMQVNLGLWAAILMPILILSS